MKLSLAGAALVTLCACTGGLHSSLSASQVYVLRAADASPAPLSGAPPSATLQVARPFAGPGLESEHIVLLQPQHRISFYAGSQWAASLPVLVERLAVEKLRGSGAWAAVNDSESAFASEYLLQITIRRFEAVYSSASAPTVWVSFDCALGRRAGRELLASFSVEGQAPASVNHVSAVVAAFDEATGVALAQLAERSSVALRNSQAPSTP